MDKKKMSSALSVIAQFITFICVAYGSYEIPNSLFDNPLITSILGLILFCASCTALFILPGNREKELQAEIQRGLQREQELEDELAHGRHLMRPIARAYKEGTEEERRILD